MSNFTKYYTKDGKKYAAYFDDLGYEYEITFSAIDDPYLEKQLFRTRNCYSMPEFDKFIEDNQYEEVMDDYKTPESKLYSKVDTALERLKDQIKNNTSSGRYEILVEKAQNLIDTIEEYTLRPRGKEDDKISDIFLFNVDEKIAEFNKKNEVKFEPLKAEELQVKEDVKLPEVGKRYKLKGTDFIEEVVEIIKGKINRFVGEDTIVLKDQFGGKSNWNFIDFLEGKFKELPEDKFPEVGKIKSGLYKVFWKSGGDSLASVGYGQDGKAWIAPTNWVSVGYFDDVIGRIAEMQSIIKDGEELPEDNIEEKPPLGLKPKYIHNEKRKDEITEAIERYKKSGKNIPREWVEELKELCGVYDVEKPKSIWKDVSELPENAQTVYLKWNDGEILIGEFLPKHQHIILPFNNNWKLELDDSRIIGYCTLTDYINNTEERLKKLEERN